MKKLVYAIAFAAAVSRVFGEEEVPKMSEQFAKYDQNKDGKLSKQELVNRFHSYFKASSVVEKLDKDMDGFLTLEESKVCLIWPNEKGVFRHLDVDGNKTISLKEFKAYAETYNVAQWFSSLDKNKDGNLGFEELRKIFKKNADK